MTNYKLQIQKGLSLLEILVVVTIFAVLGILITRAIILTVGGSRKSESLIKVRENLNYSIGVIERQLRNADSIAGCPNSDPNILNYSDQNGTATSFSCVGVGGAAGYVASGSAALTGSNINVTDCSFVCTPGSGVNPPVVSVFLEAKDASASGIQNADVTVVTQVSLRNY